MSGNGKIISFVNTDGLRAALSRVKTKVDSAISDAIAESANSLTSTITSGDTNTLNSAKSYADGLKTTIDGSIASTLASAKGYTDGIKTAIETNLDTYGVSTMSFDDSTSVLTLTMKDNNTKTVTITGTGSGSSGGNSSSTPANLTLSDITDVTATSTEVNYLSGTTSNIQTQISNLLKSVFPVIERNKYYSKGTRVASPLTPYIYFEALNSGRTGLTNTVQSISKISFDLTNNLALINNGTNRDLVTSSSVYFTPGSLFKDNGIIWLTQNFTDGNIPGQIIFKAPLNKYNIKGYLDLSKDNSCFKIGTYNNNLDINLDGLRIAREYLSDYLWLNISANQLGGYIMDQYLSIYNNSDNNNKQFFKISINISNNTETNALKTFIDNNNISSDDSKLLCYFSAIQIMKKYIDNIFEPLEQFSSIDSYTTNDFNTATGLSYTANDYLNFINALIDTINTTLPISGSSFSLSLGTEKLQNHFIKINKTDYAGNIENAGLPNITGILSSLNGTEETESSSGALYWQNTAQYLQEKREAGDYKGKSGLQINASRANSIYGNSTTVTPQNISLVPYMKL